MLVCEEKILVCQMLFIDPGSCEAINNHDAIVIGQL